MLSHQLLFRQRGDESQLELLARRRTIHPLGSARPTWGSPIRRWDRSSNSGRGRSVAPSGSITLPEEQVVEPAAPAAQAIEHEVPAVVELEREPVQPASPRTAELYCSCRGSNSNIW